jgi:5-methylcytosine-specific restriction endonuclease McrA
MTQTTETKDERKKRLARERSAAWRLANPDRTKALSEAGRVKRKAKWDEFLAAERARYAKQDEVVLAKLARQKVARDQDPERFRARVRASQRKNRALGVASCAARKAKKLQATPGWADLRAMRALYAEARRLTAETGTRHEVDHIVPLQGKLVCGLHVLCNLRVVTREANRRKGAKLETGSSIADHRSGLSRPAAVLQLP